jgi:ADP-ribosylglycohydrolase
VASRFRSFCLASKRSSVRSGCKLNHTVQGRRKGLAPVDYWSRARTPSQARYSVSRCGAYTRTGMDGVPVDDDLIYTQLGLLLLEELGLQFAMEDAARYWVRYLYWVGTDMLCPLERWRRGVPVLQAADGNPWQRMICAFIRCDPFGCVAPGWPELAGELSYRDGYVSDRRNGIYGGMFFAATIAVAMVVDDPLEAAHIGLSEIPADSTLAVAIRWALNLGPALHDYRDALRAVDERFAGMPGWHTINNACLVVFGLALGGHDVTRVIGQTVAMGMDNDCTAATAGSIVGAVVGKSGIPEHWLCPFHVHMHSCIKGHPAFSISGMVRRYARLTEGAAGMPRYWRSERRGIRRASAFSCSGYRPTRGVPCRIQGGYYIPAAPVVHRMDAGFTLDPVWAASGPESPKAPGA